MAETEGKEFLLDANFSDECTMVSVAKYDRTLYRASAFLAYHGETYLNPADLLGKQPHMHPDMNVRLRSIDLYLSKPAPIGKGHEIVGEKLLGFAAIPNAITGVHVDGRNYMGPRADVSVFDVLHLYNHAGDVVFTDREEAENGLMFTARDMRRFIEAIESTFSFQTPPKQRRMDFALDFIVPGYGNVPNNEVFSLKVKEYYNREDRGATKEPTVTLVIPDREAAPTQAS